MPRHMTRSKIATRLFRTAMVFAMWFSATAAEPATAGPIAPFTVATFADPTVNPNEAGDAPFFKVDLANDLISANWLVNMDPAGQPRKGLALVVHDASAGTTTYENAFFIMDDLIYKNGLLGGKIERRDPADPYHLRFYAENDDPAMASPLLDISFAAGRVSPGGLSASDPRFGDDVTFKGDSISLPLIDEIFSFGFANLEAINGDFFNNGFTATAAFTSSATAPESVPFVLMAFAALPLPLLYRRRRRGVQGPAGESG